MIRHLATILAIWLLPQAVMAQTTTPVPAAAASAPTAATPDAPPAGAAPPVAASPSPAATDDANSPGDGRIVGGEEALPGTAPWQVQIYSTYRYTDADTAADCRPGGDCFHLGLMYPWEKIHRCGGAYIGNNLVLTAAHCVAGVLNFGQSRRVRIGTQNINQGGVTFRIADWRVHEGYVGRLPYPNDIALIRIVADKPAARAFPLERAKIRMLGTAPGDIAISRSDTLRVTGWGRTLKREVDAGVLVDGKFNHMSEKLLQIVQLPSESACAKLADYRDRDPAKTICAVSARPGVDSCQGDSGGAVTRQEGRERVLVGLVSWGKGCAAVGMPSLYTSVPGHLAWIATARAALMAATADSRRR